MARKAKQKPFVPEQYRKIYDRTTCQKCGKPVTKKRMKDCLARQFWPVCEECEKAIIPMIVKFRKMMAESQNNYFK